MGAVQLNLMNLLIVFLLVTFMWQNAHAKYGKPCRIQNLKFMGTWVPTSSCKQDRSDRYRTFNGVQHVCCANDQIQYNLKSMEELELYSTCGKTSITRTILGKEVKEWSRPWMAVLKYKQSDLYPNVFRCGGTLISHRHVLTAGHCVKGLEDQLEKVRLREHDLSKKKDCVQLNRLTFHCLEAIDLDIDRKFIHEGFDGRSSNNDIALLRLRDYVEFNNFISPICLPITPILQQKSKTEKKFQITGWGATENSTASNVLMWSSVNKVDLNECSMQYRVKWQDSQICASGDKGDACAGDSGGPLQAQGKYFTKNNRLILFGIVSKGSVCEKNQHKLPGIYTNVSSYIQWITDKMQM